MTLRPGPRLRRLLSSATCQPGAQWALRLAPPNAWPIRTDVHVPVYLGTTATPPASHSSRGWRLDGAGVAHCDHLSLKLHARGRILFRLDHTNTTHRQLRIYLTTAVFSLTAAALPSHSPSLSTTTAARQACHLTQTLTHRPQCCSPRINAENAHIRHRCVRHRLQRSANALPSCLVTSHTDERAHPPSTHGAQRVATSKALRSRCDSSQNVTW